MHLTITTNRFEVQACKSIQSVYPNYETIKQFHQNMCNRYAITETRRKKGLSGTITKTPAANKNIELSSYRIISIYVNSQTKNYIL